VACGNNHTLVVTKDGQLYACGSNDFGQLGHDNCRTKLRMYIYKMCTLISTSYLYAYYTCKFLDFIGQIPGVESFKMTNVACGEAHSMALNEWGQLYTWGSGSCGQLGEFKNFKCFQTYQELKWINYVNFILM